MIFQVWIIWAYVSDSDQLKAYLKEAPLKDTLITNREQNSVAVTQIEDNIENNDEQTKLSQQLILIQLHCYPESEGH